VRRRRKPAAGEMPVPAPAGPAPTGRGAGATSAAAGHPAAAAGPLQITGAKGRPMLVWVGKRPLSHVTAFPAQPVERFSAGDAPPESKAYWRDWPALYPPGGLLFHGDNKEVLAHLLANGFRGKVNLVYIDPPFDSGADYVRQVSLRGATGTAKIDGEEYTLGEQIQYTDIWANDNYLQFMYERLLLLKELLSPNGSIIVHMDSSRSHYIKVVMDEVLGCDNFRNEIIVKRRITKNLQQQFAAIRQYPHAHDVLLWYSVDPAARFVPAESDQARREGGYWHHFWSGEDRPTMRYQLLGVTPAYGQWKWAQDRAERAVENYERYQAEGGGRSLEQYWAETGSRLEFIRKNLDTGKIENWFPPRTTRIANTLWLDIHAYENEKDYPTQKHEQLLQRVVGFGSKPADLVLDCFIGSGTTAAVAQKLGRRWIACDINKGAIQTTSKRLQAIMREQVEEASKRAAAGQQGTLLEGEREHEQEQRQPPAQLSFSVWRVNDYDLQIQHNEAVNLACEHIGIQRMRADGFFDGVLGKRLVKIIPFDHPLSPADLDLLKRELDSRPDDDREVTLVCLGMEIAAQAWMEDWNRLRKGKNAANRVHVIELRSDPKYGRFIRHEPARAVVKVERRKDRLRVVIDDFISPAIVERLRQQAGVLQPSIDDWRAMVDCVMIDPAWDGRVFNVALSDIPERKPDLVQGTYELPAPERETTVAVKIIDMLGEEVLHLQRV